MHIFDGHTGRAQPLAHAASLPPVRRNALTQTLVLKDPFNGLDEDLHTAPEDLTWISIDTTATSVGGGGGAPAFGDGSSSQPKDPYTELVTPPQLAAEGRKRVEKSRVPAAQSAEG